MIHSCVNVMTARHGQKCRYRNEFTCMYLADAFIQSDLQCIQVTHFLSVYVFPGNRTHNLLRCWRNALPLSHRGSWLLNIHHSIWVVVLPLLPQHILVRRGLKHGCWFKLVLSWSCLNQLKPASKLQNLPNQHMLFFFQQGKHVFYQKH